MPYVERDISDRDEIEEEINMGRQIFGLNISEEQAKLARRMLVTCSSLRDPGDDWSAIELFDEDGDIITKEVISGY
jgi:hypothetical protein